MRVQGPNGTGVVSSQSATRRSSTGTFSLNEESETARPSSSATTLRSIGGIDALIALQGIEDPTERRRRAVRRGRTALDALDQLKISLLDGTLDRATLGRLKDAAAGLKDPTGDPGLDGVLAEIELRVEVEIAKMDAS
jgi:Class II flagellar assembly regulator